MNKLVLILGTCVVLFSSSLVKAQPELPLGVLHLLLKKKQSWWGVVSEVYCNGSPLTFSVTTEGVTRESICEDGNCPTTELFGLPGNPGFGSFEGWVTTDPGMKTFSYTIDAPACGGVFSGSFNLTLEKDKTYLITLVLYGNPPTTAVGNYTFPGSPPAP